jgi:hypothetical protein
VAICLTGHTRIVAAWQFCFLKTLPEARHSSFEASQASESGALDPMDFIQK